MLLVRPGAPVRTSIFVAVPMPVPAKVALLPAPKPKLPKVVTLEMAP